MQDTVVGLTPVGTGDAQLIFDAWGSHPQNFSYLTARAFRTVADAERYLSDLSPTAASKAWHILGPDERIVGIVKVAIVGHRAQIGYVVHEPFSGRGFATAAVRQVTTIVEALPDIRRVWATCAIENHASARVLEKCGFEREGILRNWVIYPAQGDRAFDNYSYVRIPRGGADGR